jgi:hypothetical protein
MNCSLLLEKEQWLPTAPSQMIIRSAEAVLTLGH